MKIGIDARNIYQLESGDGRYAISIIASLAQIDRQNDYVIWVRPGKESLFALDNPRFKVKAVNIPAYSIREQLVMSFVVMKEKVDVYHSFCFSMPYFIAARPIITIYDLIFLNVPQFYSSFKSWMGKMLIAACSAKAAAIVTVSEHSKKDITRHFARVTPEKINVVYCGANSCFEAMNKNEARQAVLKRFGVAGDFLLYVGNMNPHKNIPTLIKVFKACLARHPGLVLVICGKKKISYASLQELARKLDIEKHIFFIDSADDASQAMLYSAAKLFVFLSLYEGFGMPPLEAMSCGTPVVASNRTSIPEVLRDAACLVDPQDEAGIVREILRLLSDTAAYEALRAKGLSLSREYNWETSSKQMLALYAEAAKGHRCAPEEVADHLQFSSQPEVSVIIPSFDGSRGGNLARLMDDLKQQHYRNFEVHVVKRVSPQGKAINTGARRAKADIFVVMDDDSRVDNPDVLKNLVDALKKDQTIGMAGASIVVPSDANRLQKRAGKEFPRFGMQVLEKTAESDMACHGCCAIPRKVFEEVGGERENILRGLDPDLRVRMRKLGYKTVIVANTWVYHPLPATLGKFVKTFFRNGMGSAYCQKYQPGLIYDTDEAMELKSFQARVPFGARLLRFPLRLVKALVELKLLRLLAYSVYAAGFGYGYVQYTFKKK